mmetsp:Transcript_15326/g.21150  ORF Transcript_15326/g.21150 Transcript_15326/m.21150 type:complete len:347 (-) Transcript_15326:118-1158(-)
MSQSFGKRVAATDPDVPFSPALPSPSPFISSASRQAKGKRLNLPGTGHRGRRQGPGLHSRRRLQHGEAPALRAISRGDIRRLARRAGVKRLGEGVYYESKQALHAFLKQAVRHACTYAEHARRHTICITDVLMAYKRMGRTLYGPWTGLPFPSPRAQRLKKLRSPLHVETLPTIPRLSTSLAPPSLHCTLPLDPVTKHTTSDKSTASVPCRNIQTDSDTTTNILPADNKDKPMQSSPAKVLTTSAPQAKPASFGGASCAAAVQLPSSRFKHIRMAVSSFFTSRQFYDDGDMCEIPHLIEALNVGDKSTHSTLQGEAEIKMEELMHVLEWLQDSNRFLIDGNKLYLI